MAHLNLTLLGGFRARFTSGQLLTLPTGKIQALLAYLALRPGQTCSREKLAALLWGDSAEEQARHSLRQALFALNQVLPRTKPASLLLDGGAIALNPVGVNVDVAAFERLAADGTPDSLERAGSLYQGDLLDGFSVREASFEEWLRGERERLREVTLQALGKLLAHQAGVGAVESAIRTAVRLLALDPFHEAVHRTLMRLYVRLGRRGAAFRQYQVCADTLRRELGVEPQAETKRLFEEAVSQRSPGREVAPIQRRQRVAQASFPAS